MKTNAIVRIVLFTIIIVVLVGALVGTLFFHMFRIDSFAPMDVETNVSVNSVSGDGSSYSLPVGDITDLEIHWVAGSISVAYGDTDEIIISETPSKRYPMICRQDGDKLLIQYCERRLMGFHFDIPEKNLTITIPRSWVPEQLEIDTVSADLDVSGLTLKELDINSVSAVCDLQECSAEDFSVETVSGDIRFSGTLGSFSCDAVSGDCTAVLQNTPREIKMAGLSGDLALSLPEDTGFSAKLDSANGDFSSDFPVTKSGRDYSFGDGRCQITIEGLSGNISIRKTS